MEPTLSHYLLVSGALFSIGLLGVIVRRNLLIIYMSLELMLNAANVALVAMSGCRGGGWPGADRGPVPKTPNRRGRGFGDDETLRWNLLLGSSCCCR